MTRPLNRRDFIRGSAALAAAGFSGCAALPAPRRMSPNDKLNIACVGTDNRAAEDINGVLSENIVAFCDIDDNLLAAAQKKFPKAKAYADFRLMLEQKDIDAVVIGTPDHIHAPAAAMAMHLGKHVYCEKPLTHTVYEARHLATLAKKMGVATQMGTQIHAGDNYRRAVEVIQSNAIGPVSEVHVWVGKGWAGDGRAKDPAPVPPNLHWDLWLGPAPDRPYSPIYQPQNWRRWWDFGGGTLGDMGCHYTDLPFWALGLTRPTSVEAEGPKPDAETAPSKLTVRWEFPARGAQPACKLTWYDDGLRPKELAEAGIPPIDSGVLFVGSKGMMLADYNMWKLYPEKDFAGYQPPMPSIPASIGHHKEWILACKTGAPTTCDFGYSGPLTETILLGNVAFRSGKKLEWDWKKLKATNAPEADQFIQREYRKGWTL